MRDGSARAGHERALQEFSVARMAERTVEVYREALLGRGGRRT